MATAFVRPKTNTVFDKEEKSMSMFDELKKKGMDLMKDPAKRAKIEQMAKEKGISIDKAKEHFTKRKKQ